MCYSAQVTQNYREYVRMFGADIDLKEFVRLYWERPKTKARIAKGLDVAFADADGEDARTIISLIDGYNDDQIALIEGDLVKQRDRLAAAKLALQNKVHEEGKRRPPDRDRQDRQGAREARGHPAARCPAA